jgi:hypothetical protein
MDNIQRQNVRIHLSQNFRSYVLLRHLHLSLGTEEHHEAFQSAQAVSQPEFEPNFSRMQTNTER